MSALNLVHENIRVYIVKQKAIKNLCSLSYLRTTEVAILCWAVRRRKLLGVSNAFGVVKQCIIIRIVCRLKDNNNKLLVDGGGLQIN